MWRTHWTCGRGGCGGDGRLADAVDVAEMVDLRTQRTCGRMESVDHECDQGPGDGKEEWGLCCSHIGSKNISFF